MKKIIHLFAFVLLFGCFSELRAQEEVKDDVKQAGKSVKKGAKKAGRKTAEVASKGKAKITDQDHKDKVGPNGQTIYIDNHSRYYWVDKRGKRHYVKENQLRPKVDD